jgi:CubicO group peptidase (beta-lactamase class C family)
VRAARASTGLLAVLALASCGPGKHTDEGERPVRVARQSSPTQIEAAPRDGRSARKRACVDELTTGVDLRLHALLRSLCSEWVELEIPGLALAYVEPGAAPIHVELGVRCSGEPGEVTATTAFRLGSITKTVTAALALGLVDERDDLELTSDATLIPGFRSPAGLAPPQLGALLDHRSGLGEIDGIALVILGGAWLPALAGSHAKPPGEYRYSNAGYAVLGAMLEAVSGQPYAALIEARVAWPLGLTSLTADVTTPAGACGHLVHDRERHPIPIAEDLDFMPGDPRWMDAGGGLLSSAEDLAHFALALGSEALPGSEAMLELGEPLPSGPEHAGRDDLRYRYGLRSWRRAGRRLYGHSGNNVAFSAELVFVPGERAIAIVANTGVKLPATLAAAEALLASP